MIKPKISKKKTMLELSAVIVIVLITLVLGYYFLFMNKNSEPTATQPVFDTPNTGIDQPDLKSNTKKATSSIGGEIFNSEKFRSLKESSLQMIKDNIVSGRRNPFESYNKKNKNEKKPDDSQPVSDTTVIIEKESIAAPIESKAEEPGNNN
jgi:hypothetical protein